MTATLSCSVYIVAHFNSHAHVERDDVVSDFHTKVVDFNSHAHVERDLNTLTDGGGSKTFQLTRSRGA